MSCAVWLTLCLPLTKLVNRIRKKKKYGTAQGLYEKIYYNFFEFRYWKTWINIVRLGVDIVSNYYIHKHLHTLFSCFVLSTLMQPSSFIIKAPAQNIFHESFSYVLYWQIFNFYLLKYNFFLSGNIFPSFSKFCESIRVKNWECTRSTIYFGSHTSKVYTKKCFE